MFQRLLKDQKEKMEAQFKSELEKTKAQLQAQFESRMVAFEQEVETKFTSLLGKRKTVSETAVPVVPATPPVTATASPTKEEDKVPVRRQVSFPKGVSGLKFLTAQWAQAKDKAPADVDMNAWVAGQLFEHYKRCVGFTKIRSSILKLINAVNKEGSLGVLDANTVNNRVHDLINNY